MLAHHGPCKYDSSLIFLYSDVSSDCHVAKSIKCMWQNLFLLSPWLESKHMQFPALCTGTVESKLVGAS